MDYIFLALFSLAATIFIYNSHYRWTYLFAISLFVMFAGSMLALSGQWQRGLNFASVLFVVLMLFHRLKIHYYKQPLLISDLWLVGDWRNWETLLHYRGAILAVFGLIGLLGYAIFGWSEAEPMSALWRVLAGLSALIAFALMWHYSKNKEAVQVWLDSLPDDGRDVFLNLPMSCRGVFFKTPSFEATGEYFQQQRQSIAPQQASAEQKPDIVVCLQESTLNPHQFAFEQENLPPFSMFERQPDTSFASNLRVHTLGGATWKSEFAFLAGVPSTDFGAMASGVFYSVVPHLRYGFIQNLRAQGYFCVALSPFTKGNYNAKSAYDHFGFDMMFQPQDLGYPAPLGKNLWHISSQEMLDYAQMLLERKHPSLQAIQQPMFVYVLTMREHGPYHANTENIFNLQADLPSRVIGCLNDYSQRIQALNEAVEGFNQYLQARNQPYVFCYFGDHQVGFENYVVPKKWDYAQPDYVTQIAVRSNCAQAQPQQDFLDLAQAGGLLLEIAGLDADEFMQANIAMRKLTGGKLEDCEDKALLESYRAYLYQDLKITD